MNISPKQKWNEFIANPEEKLAEDPAFLDNLLDDAFDEIDNAQLKQAEDFLRNNGGIPWKH